MNITVTLVVAEIIRERSDLFAKLPTSEVAKVKRWVIRETEDHAADFLRETLAILTPSHIREILKTDV